MKLGVDTGFYKVGLYNGTKLTAKTLTKISGTSLLKIFKMLAVHMAELPTIPPDSCLPLSHEINQP